MKAESEALHVVPVSGGDAGEPVKNALEVVGRVLIASGVEGELLRTTNLARPGTGASIAAQLRSEDRAATVTLKDVGTKVILYPGAQVDVLATMQVIDARGQRRTATRTILENRRVLAVDDEIAGGESSAIDDDGRRRPPARSITVTLAVRPGEVEQLALASELGAIGLVLRSLEDGDAAASTVATPETLFGEDRSRASAPRRTEGDPPANSSPSGLDADWWEVVVVRPGKSEQHRFESTDSDEEN